jgi:hypothetical protein
MQCFLQCRRPRATKIGSIPTEENRSSFGYSRRKVFRPLASFSCSYLSG